MHTRRWWPPLAPQLLKSALLPALLCALLCALLWPLALRAAPDAPAEPADARAWLARIHAAASQRNYQGTMVFTAGGVLSSSRVAHFCVGEQSFERVEAQDGRMQRVYRHNDAVHTLWPQLRVAVVEQRGVLTALRAPLQPVEPRALEQYELRAEGAERVAGRDAVVFVLQPRDELRYAQRLWADKASGLMLRADVLAAGGRTVLESAAFSEVEIGIKPQPEAVLQAMKNLSGYRVLRPQLVRTQLDTEGWALQRQVPGFQLVGCLKRPLQAASTDAPAPEPVLQAVFSDGLTHVSVFVEAFDAKRHRAGLQAQLGATSTVMARHGEHWVTAMGDVPTATLKMFAQALERKR